MGLRKKEQVTCQDCVWLNWEKKKCMFHKVPRPLSRGVLDAEICGNYDLGSRLNFENLSWILKGGK